MEACNSTFRICGEGAVEDIKGIAFFLLLLFYEEIRTRNLELLLSGIAYWLQARNC